MEYNFIKVTLKETKSKIVENWNNEFPHFPLSDRLIDERFINHPDTILSYSLVNEKDYIGTLVLKKCVLRGENQGYISFIYICNKYRNLGYGKRMLDEAVEIFKKQGLTRMYLGSDYGCAFSGLFIDNNKETHDYFINYGFHVLHSTHNLIITKNPEWDKNKDICYELLTEDRREEFNEFTKTFSVRWNKENLDAECRDICLLIFNNRIVGFSRICTSDSKTYSNGINTYVKYEKEGCKLGALGPLGVDANYRKLGLGKQVVLFGIDSLYKRGCNKVLVDWTGLVDFYKKCGFEDVCDMYTFYEYNII